MVYKYLSLPIILALLPTFAHAQGPVAYLAATTGKVTYVSPTTPLPTTGGGSGGATITQPLGVTTTQTGSTVTTHAVFQAALAASATRKGCLIQNTSADIEYIFFGATASATTSNTLQVAAGGSISCVTGGVVLQDNVAISSKTTDGATYVVTSQ